jgi:hypothetical protein
MASFNKAHEYFEIHGIDNDAKKIVKLYTNPHVMYKIPY